VCQFKWCYTESVSNLEIVEIRFSINCWLVDGVNASWTLNDEKNIVNAITEWKEENCTIYSLDASLPSKNQVHAINYFFYDLFNDR